MDIFTTQLVRVVPVPIKPANLKVKALLKEAAAGKLKEDHDHLENHDYYFISSKKKSQNNSQNNTQQSSSHPPLDNNGLESEKELQKLQNEQPDKEQLIEGKDKKPHLDIFV